MFEDPATFKRPTVLQTVAFWEVFAQFVAREDLEMKGLSSRGLGFTPDGGTGRWESDYQA